jgi:tryptophan-rich sensory protein
MSVDSHAIMSFVVSAVSVLTTSISGTYFTNKGTNTNWYTCIKPDLAPPNITFPIVWTILYVLLFVAFANTIQNKEYLNVILVGISLSLNILWTFLFFARRYVTIAAFIIYTMVLLAIMIVVIAFWKGNKLVGFLVLPYALWLCYAAILNTMSIRRVKTCKVISEEEQKKIH